MRNDAASKPSLLIIDDNARLLRGLERLLGGHFYVTTACSASEALAMLNVKVKEQRGAAGQRASSQTPARLATSAGSGEPTPEGVERRFDVVIVDNQMPGMMGLQVVALLQRARPEIVPILMTGEVTLALKHAVKHELGGVRLLQKPFRGAHVIKVVCHALEEQRAQIHNGGHDKATAGSP